MRLIIAVCAPALAALALVGCGGGEATSLNPTTASEVSAPIISATISGAPATSVAVGAQYSFAPTASDSDGRVMTFSIKNAPSWATFNTATGQLSGSPTSTDVGVTSGIVITVADGSATASLTPFSITVSGSTAPGAGSATLSWVAPTKNTDGSPLMNLGGYNIYYGTDASALTQTIQVTNASALGYVVSGLATGTTWYFTVTSYTTAGEESPRSAILTKTI